MSQAREVTPRARSGISAARRAGTLTRVVRGLSPLFFLLPALTLVGALLLWPFLRTAYLSFTTFAGIGPIHFVGLQNYSNLLSDPAMTQSLKNTLYWVIGTMLLPVGLGLVIAVVSYDLRGGSVYRLPMLIPYALSGTAIGVMWEFMLRTDGALNGLLGAIGLGSLAHSWLLRPPLNTWSMIVASTWQTTGVSVLLFIIGLQVIPRDPLEAARLDGAEGWRLFRDMIFPLLRPMTVVVVGISLVNSLKTFDIVWVMTQGGPYRSSETLAVTMYRDTFLLLQYGYGSAVAVLLSVIVVVISLLYLGRTLRST